MGVEMQLKTNIDSSDKLVDMLYGHFRVMPSPFQVSQMGWEAEDAAFATDRRGPAAFATDGRERGRPAALATDRREHGRSCPHVMVMAWDGPTVHDICS